MNIKRREAMLRNLLISLMLAPVFLAAQTTPLNDLFDDLVDKPGYSTTEIRTQEVSFDWENDQDTKKLREVLDGIESIRILSYDQEDENARKDVDQVYRKVEKALVKEDYEEAMAFSSDEDHVNIYFLKQGNRVREFALVSKGAHKISMITVTGDIDLARVMQKETMKGLWSLKSVYSKGDHMEVEMNGEMEN